MASTYIELEQAAGRFAELVAQVGDGDEVVITRDHQPVAKLVAVEQPVAKRALGTARGLITIADDFDAPLEEFKEYMR
jgi:prevent-host-death family protein